MTCQAVQLNLHVVDLIKKHFSKSKTKFDVKRNYIQFYAQSLFNDESKPLELLICVTPFEDKVNSQPSRLIHSPYRLHIRLTQKVDINDPETGLDDLQQSVFELRKSLMQQHEDHNPFEGFCSQTNQPHEPTPVKYPTPEVSVNVVSAIMTLEVPFEENI